MSHSFDLIAIGAGSGGISVVERAAEYGARCAVIEPAHLGGTCVNVGCVPKKIMWNAASLAHGFRDAKGYGFDVGLTNFSWKQLVDARENHIQGIREWYGNYLSDSEIEFIAGEAKFIDKHTLQVGDEIYHAKHIVVATGSYPKLPNIPGAGLGITSDGFFKLAQQPKRVAIVGAGYIAVELAGLLQALGSEVCLILRRDRFLGRFDAMLREALMEEMINAGVTIIPHIQVERIEEEGHRLAIHCQNGVTLEQYDSVLWAIGRAPASGGLALEKVGVQLDAEGYIVTDAYQNTDVEGIYAVGDVCGRAPLTPVAIAAGRRLADRLFAGQTERKLDYDLIPTVVFSHPPIATIGLTEEEARAQHGDAVRVYQSRYINLYHALTPQSSYTSVKLITVGAKERVVGCHVIGRGADEMLQGFAVAMKMGASKKDLDDTVAIHPSSAEELVTLR